MKMEKPFVVQKWVATDTWIDIDTPASIKTTDKALVFVKARAEKGTFRVVQTCGRPVKVTTIQTVLIEEA
jgi:hypothetical protein